MVDSRENRFDESSATSVGEAKEIIEHHLRMLWRHPERANEVPPLMLWGAPGIGKSAIISDMAKELGIGFIDVRLAQREPVDIRGLPVPRDDRSGVDWIVSSEWPREGQEDYNERGIILFDELTAADPTLQVASYEFILDRRLGKLYEVPPGWYIIAAGNRTSDAAVARTMSSALANRFCHLELIAKSKSWIEWALIKGIESTVIAFIRYRPELLFNMTGNRERGWPSPRTWERVSLELQLAKETSLSQRALRSIIEGLVGPGAAIEFLGFLKWAESIPDIEAMLRGEIEITFPERSDQRFAMVSAAVHTVLESSEPEDLVTGLLRFLIEIPNDWAQMAHHDLSWSLSTLERFSLLEAIHENGLHKKLEDKIFIDTNTGEK
jgi:hypothetical protein